MGDTAEWRHQRTGSPCPPWNAGPSCVSRKRGDVGISVAPEGRQKVAPGKRKRSRGIAGRPQESPRPEGATHTSPGQRPGYAS